MAKLKVAFRQLYLSSGCQIENGEEVRHQFDFDGFEVNLYIGQKPTLNIVDTPKDILHHDPLNPEKSSVARKLNFVPVEQTPYNGCFFTEVFVVKYVEVSDDLYKEATNPATETKSRSKIADQAKLQYGKSFSDIASFFTGMIGLRYHMQFVITNVNEHYWLWNELEQAWRIESIGTMPIRILEAITLNQSGKEQIQQTKMKPAANLKLIRSASISFKFLIKAWSEYNGLDKFIYLYTALEVAIKSDNFPSRFVPRSEIQALVRLVQTMPDSKEKVELEKYIEGHSKRKVAFDLFVDLAEHANFETQEDDIEAFKLFNKVRNDLMHGGTETNLHSVKLKSGKSVVFESFVERYVNWAYFEDTSIYPSRYRPDRPVVKTKNT